MCGRTKETLRLRPPPRALGFTGSGPGATQPTAAAGLPSLLPRPRLCGPSGPVLWSSPAGPARRPAWVPGVPFSPVLSSSFRAQHFPHAGTSAHVSDGTSPGHPRLARVRCGQARRTANPRPGSWFLRFRPAPLPFPRLGPQEGPSAGVQTWRRLPVARRLVPLCAPSGAAVTCAPRRTDAPPTPLFPSKPPASPPASLK